MQIQKIQNDDSTSFKPEVMYKMWKVFYGIDKRVYNEIFDSKGKYDRVAAIRHCILRRATIAQNVECEELPEEFKKYDSFFWRTLHRIYVNLKRLQEIYEK